MIRLNNSTFLLSVNQTIKRGGTIQLFWHQLPKRRYTCNFSPRILTPTALEQASLIGSLPQVCALHTSMTSAWERNPTFQKSAQQTVDTAMYDAAIRNHVEIVAYFLDRTRGVGISERVVAATRESGTMDVFEVLLGMGGY